MIVKDSEAGLFPDEPFSNWLSICPLAFTKGIFANGSFQHRGNLPQLHENMYDFNF